MTGVLCLLVYGAVLAWVCPPLLHRLTRAGTSPRLSVAVWLTAIVVTAGVWLTAGIGLAADLAVGHVPATPVRYCLDVVLALHRLGWIGHLALAGIMLAGLAISVVALGRILRTLRVLSARSRDHAHTAHLVGTAHDDVLVVASEHAAAYSVAGRPSAIVVTSGAVSTLEDDELRAVLAHERAHLRGRHPQLLMVLTSLVTTLPGLPLIRAGAEAVGRLVEMSADDAAARHHGNEAVLSGLVAFSAEPFSDTAVLARTQRLLAPAGRSVQLRHHLVLIATMAIMAAAPVAILMLGHRV